MTLHASRHSRVVLVAATFMLGATTLVAHRRGASASTIWI